MNDQAPVPGNVGKVFPLFKPFLWIASIGSTLPELTVARAAAVNFIGFVVTAVVVAIGILVALGWE